MAAFDAHSDQVVRAAVDAYLQGRTRPTVPPEATFETRNSRYGLRNGAIAEARDSALLGCELVGWLVDEAGAHRVSSLWQPSARAVMVDRRRGCEIVVTSATKALHAGSGPSPHQTGSAMPQSSRSPGVALPIPQPPPLQTGRLPMSAGAMLPPPFPPPRSTIRPSTPAPSAVSAAPRSVAPPPPPSSPIPLRPKSASAIHAPPRPRAPSVPSMPAIPPMPALAAPPRPPVPAAAPLPPPLPPPRSPLPPPRTPPPPPSVPIPLHRTH